MGTYCIETQGKVTKDTTISLYSDFHIHEKDHSNRYNKVIDNLERLMPDYIFILGDFINDTNISPNEIDYVYKYLSLLSSIAPVYYVYGNHEMRTKINFREVSLINNSYFNMVSTVKNLNVLNNNSILLKENIGLTGIVLPFNYYVEEFEDKEVYLEYVRKYIKNNLLGNLDNNSFNILLQHTPNNILDKETYLRFIDAIKEILKRDYNFDLTISGHLHNGLIPVYLEKYIPGNKGIVGITGPKKHLFQYNCRGIMNITDNTTGIVLLAVSTIPGSILNNLFPPGEKTLILKK